jgi:hypothetical protein
MWVEGKRNILREVWRGQFMGLLCVASVFPVIAREHKRHAKYRLLKEDDLEIAKSVFILHYQNAECSKQSVL